jgi:A/G-specific adenine glycosylase
MAFGSEEPVLDGNVRRVFARLLAVRHPRDADLWKLAHDLVRGSSPGDWNQALMELGATRCTPEKPRCGSCPLGTGCAGYASGRPEAYPAPPPRREVRRVRVAVALVRARGRILLERKGAQSPLRGTWDLPAIEIATDDDARQALATRWGARRRLTLHVGPEETRARHAILDRRLSIEAYACRISRGKPDGTRLRWIGVDEISVVPVSGATKKILRQLRERDETKPSRRPARPRNRLRDRDREPARSPRRARAPAGRTSLPSEGPRRTRDRGRPSRRGTRSRPLRSGLAARSR